jgi:hypothetical protein
MRSAPGRTCALASLGQKPRATTCGKRSRQLVKGEKRHGDEHLKLGRQREDDERKNQTISRTETSRALGAAGACPAITL